MSEIKQVTVSKILQREEFFKSNPDAKDIDFNIYWYNFVEFDVPNLYPFASITITDKDLDSIDGVRIIIEPLNNN